MVIGQTRQTEARVKTNAPRKIEKRKSRRSRRIPVDLLLPIGVHLPFLSVAKMCLYSSSWRPWRLGGLIEFSGFFHLV
jgi:hypothetical protein